MMDVIQYIRSFFVSNRTKRKRSTTELFEESFHAKQRKLSANSPEDDWIISTRRFYPRTQMDNNRVLKPTIVLDDDDVPDYKKYNGARPKIHITSTPHPSHVKENGPEITLDKCRDILKDVVPLCSRREDKFGDKLNASKLSSHSIYYTPRVQSKESLFTLPSGRKYGVGTTTDMAFRLDEKRKYQELLSKSNWPSSNHSLVDSFIDYYTPLSKTPQSRARRMVDMATKTTPVTVDLTNGHMRREVKSPNKTATSETILKVLDDLDSDVVLVKEEDSDVEFLPTPPSPKRDFNIERVNSLKQLVVCEPLKDNWIGDKIRRHEEDMHKFKNELAARHEQLLEVRQINHDIVREQLAEQVKKCLNIKEVVIPIEVKQTLPELTPKQEQIVEYAFDKRAGQGAVLASKFSLNITRRDMLTLSGLNWLNDEVINFYMNLIIERGKMDRYPKAYAFNTFFYPKILKDGQQSVRRWTRKVDLFGQDVVCVPIHLGMHWCMAIIDLRSKTITYYDSMGKQNHQCTEALFKYLKDEHLDKKQCEMNAKGWRLLCPKDIPQQMNGSDCGMFSCTFAEFASRNAQYSFSQEDMPYLRRKMVVEIMSGQLLIQ